MGCGPRRSLAAAASATVLVAAAAAHAAEVAIECPRLDASASEELSARARLVLRVVSDELVQRVVVHCDSTTAWLTWNDDSKRAPIDESASLIEGALDAIEMGLEQFVPRTVVRPGAKGQAPESRNEAPDLASPKPSDEREPPRASPRRTPGGVGLNLTGELWKSPRIPSFGPHFDVAVGSGLLTAVVNGGFTTAPSLARSAFVVDTQLGVGWGAPYAPQSVFGATLLTGGEWFAGVGPDGNPSADLTSVAWIISAGARCTVEHAGPVALWLGLDVRGRFARQELGSPLNYRLYPVSLLAMIGGFVLVDG